MAVDTSLDVSPERAMGPAVDRGRGVAVLSAAGDPAGPGAQPSPPLRSAPLAHAAVHAAAEIPPEMCEQHSGGGLGTTLEPVLRRACEGRLSKLSWFRTDWQRGGALTANALMETPDGPCDVVVKMPVPPCERHWLVALEGTGVTPRVFAHGETLNGYDLAWVVMERLPHGPLGPQWGGREFDLVVEAAGRFYAATSAIPHRGEPLEKDWAALLDRARKKAAAGALPEAQVWNQLLKGAGKKLREWLAVWHSRPIHDWCHGDLHLGNALTRQPAPEGPALLIDFALTRPGHWVQDAVYFEHLFWAQRERLGGRKLASLIARERKKHGLPVDADWARLADVFRGLLAMAAPASLEQSGDPLHLRAAREVLERAV